MDEHQLSSLWMYLIRDIKKLGCDWIDTAGGVVRYKHKTVISSEKAKIISTLFDRKNAPSIAALEGERSMTKDTRFLATGEILWNDSSTLWNRKSTTTWPTASKTTTKEMSPDAV